MRLKTFIIVFLSLSVILACSSAIIFLQMQAMKGVKLGLLEDKLYAENASILSWAMKNMEPGKINPSGLPRSWGEIMVVDNQTLEVKSSTNTTHLGAKVSAIPELLDQAAPVLASIGKATSGTVKTRDYVIVLSPLAEGSTLIGLKPKVWEKDLLASQSRQLQQGTSSSMNLLMGYAAGGFVLAVILSLIIAFVATSPVSRAVKAFEDLSLGNFEATLPRTGGKTLVRLSDSFFRLKTSMKYALERLGR